MPKLRPLLFALIFSLNLSTAFGEDPLLDALGAGDIKTVDSILLKLKSTIEDKRGQGTLPALTFEELYSPLNDGEKKFLKTLQAVPPETLGIKTPYLGIPETAPDLVRIENQPVQKDGQSLLIDAQYLPVAVYEQYESMMQAMEKELGRRLYVESGYRSPAYQLYLFVYYLVQHRYSVRETAQWNAFPGYSEHGWPDRQAIDFISKDGVSGEGKPELFEKLAEYEWLLKHAGKYHFFLSYPKNNSTGVSFEPWHWHYEEPNALPDARKNKP